MSKKIIYLLSLLMALSLVFASCKKNSSTGVGDEWVTDPPKEEDNTEGLVDDDGLANVTDSDQLVSDKPLITEVVFQGNGVDYLRNPVVVVMGEKSNQVAVFAEKRYKSKGAVNDVGINGKDAVDILVKVSGNAGKRFEEEQIVGAQATGAVDSHGAPVVFKVSNTDVIVVASAGGGIARTSEDAQKGTGTESKPASKIEYIHGKLNGNTFQWDTWTELKLDNNASLLDEIQKIQAVNGTDYYTQMGTHSAKGQAIISGSTATLILPVVMAQQGNSTTVKEMMGVYFVKGEYTSGSSVTWTKIGNGTEGQTYIKFARNGNNNTSHFKEARIIQATSESDFKYVVVPGYGKSVYGLGQNVAQPVDSSITGHFGSPGYLTLTWKGGTSYNPQEYKNDAPDQSLFMAAKAAAPNGNVTLYKVVKDTLTINGQKSHVFNQVSKSASIDVLGDGTVVSVAEEGADGEMNFYSVFKRYSQKYLASLLD